MERLPAVLAADAVWDGLLGIVFCLVPWSAHRLPAASPWPLFLVLGAGCFAFAALLTQAARGRNTVAVARLAAISNAAGMLVAIVVVVLLHTPLQAAAVAVVGAGCGLFAVLEWLGVRRVARVTP